MSVFSVISASLVAVRGERNHTPPCSSEELVFAEKNGGRRGKIAVVDMASLVFIGLLWIYHQPGKSALMPEEFSMRFSIGGGSVRVFFCLLSELSLSFS